jgi:LysM repeat protein
LPKISYNGSVSTIKSIKWLFLFLLLAGLLTPPAGARARASQPKILLAPHSEVTAFDLILAMNTLRSSYGLAPLIEDPIINAVAQSTAEIMAANQMSWHIGNVSGRLQSAGYGGGATVWGTENFAVGFLGIDEIMIAWSDESHMIPAVKPAYCHVGAGVAKSPNGMTYYVLQAAYTSSNSCGAYQPPSKTSVPGSPDEGGGSPGVSQLIVPVKIATPDAEGKIFHVVEAGQSFWAIAVTYKITIKDLETWNNISKDSALQVGQRLFIPSSNTAGYSTPTPVGMIQLGTPDQDGKVIHTVQAYQTLITISEAYGVTIDAILALNGLQVDWPLQIGQKLMVSPGNVTPTATPQPLTPIEKLTPANDGKYYHLVQPGETLSWIADLYEVSFLDLMAWNALGADSILYPDQKLVLQVTPPATNTPSPGPPTETLTATQEPPTATSTSAPTLEDTQPAPTVVSASVGGADPGILLLSVGLLAGGLALVSILVRRKR